MNWSIVPIPRKCRIEKELLNFTRSEWIRVDPALSPALKRCACAFAAEASPRFTVPLKVAAGQVQGPVLLTITKRAADAFPAQGYRLTSSPKGIALEASDEAGAFYGLQTLRQFMAQGGARLPRFSITDHPDFPQRGVMLDVSRAKVPTMDTLFKLVDRLAALKLNQLQLYIEHTFAYSAQEAVWHDASPFTAAEILELDAYCKDRCIELVPNFNSFGHFEQWLKHPEYRHLAECPDGFEYPWGGRSSSGSVLKPNRESLDFLDALYCEYLPNFSSRLLNVGCDETWELGHGWSKPLCEKTSTTRIYLDFLLQIHRMTKRHRRQMMFWGDIILHQPKLIGELPQDVIALEWGYEYNHPFEKHCPLFAKSGIPFYVCPGTSSWNSITGRTLNCVGNLANAAANGLAHGSIGFLNTDWGDGGHHQYLPVSYTGYVAGAAYSWCLKANRDVDVPAAMNRLMFDDPSGVLGDLFFELGKVRELVKGRSGNCSIFNALLFWNMEPGTMKLDHVTPTMLRRCLVRLDELEARIADARAQADDAELAKAELRNGIAMARHATHRGLAAMDRKMKRAPLRRELLHIIGQHEALWLSRNRPGGLHISSARLRNALAPLK